MEDHHRILLPRLARLPAPDATPEVDHLLAVVVRGTSAAQLSPSSEVLCKGIADGLESVAYAPLSNQMV